MSTRQFQVGLCAVALGLCCVGCASRAQVNVIATQPTVPHEDEQLILNQIMVVVDASESMEGPKMHREKALVDAFTHAMPDGSYEAGIDSFSSVDRDDWVRCPVAPYDRGKFDNCEASIELLGGLTPLATSLDMLYHEFDGKGGYGALLVFSDGEVDSDQGAIESCKRMAAAHGGRFCVYTVQIGDCARGHNLLQAMTTSTGCGRMWTEADLNSAAAIDAMVRTIFFGPKPKPTPPPPPPVPARRETTILGEVLFDFDKAVLKPEGKVAVDKMVEEMKANPSENVEIQGHTCDIGTDAYNMKLSQRRADSVRDYMVSQGIDGARLTCKPYGESKPAVPNTSEANRHLNRRIVFVR